MQVYTIGHSNHTWDTFVELLRAHEVKALVDVRSKPVSRWARFANKRTLASLCESEGIQHAFMGDTLGGKPDDPAYYDAEGKPEYAKIAAKEAFRGGIKALVEIARQARTAIMCAEEDPVNCHRSLLVRPALERHGVEMRHIRKDGSAEVMLPLQ